MLVARPLCAQALQDPSQQRLTCVRVSPSGRYMAIGGDDEFVKVRVDLNDIDEGIGSSSTAVRCCAFSA